MIPEPPRMDEARFADLDAALRFLRAALILTVVGGVAVTASFVFNII